MMPPDSVEKTAATIDRENNYLIILCDRTVCEIAYVFVDLLNCPMDGGSIFPQYEVHNADDDSAEITHGSDAQFILMRDKDSIHIGNGSNSVPFSLPFDENICTEYERLCNALGAFLDDGKAGSIK